MQNIFSDINPSDITTQATGFFVAFAPYVELVVGILLAFLVIRFLVGMLKINRNKKYNVGDDTESPYLDEDDWEDFDDDDDY
jgi:hypothetical protein